MPYISNCKPDYSKPTGESIFNVINLPAVFLCVECLGNTLLVKSDDCAILFNNYNEELWQSTMKEF